MSDARDRFAGQPGGRLGELGQREEALAAIREAVTIRQELAAVRQDAFCPDLAMSLNNLSLQLPTWGGGRKRWRRSRKPSPSAES